jgi:hypothetical protein
MCWLCGARQIKKKCVLKVLAGKELCFSWDKAQKHVQVWYHRV